jgi:hypothetical protein
MDNEEIRAALLNLSRAADRLAQVLGGAPSSPAIVAQPASITPAWRSPTLDLEPVVVLGEDDLHEAFARGHRLLVHDGAGGLQEVTWGDAERLGRLALTLVGDVALEAAHAGVQGSRSAVDAMLRRSFAALEAAAGECGLEVPAAEFISATAQFSELDSRSAEWR